MSLDYERQRKKGEDTKCTLESWMLSLGPHEKLENENTKYTVLGGGREREYDEGEREGSQGVWVNKLVSPSRHGTIHK